MQDRMSIIFVTLIESAITAYFTDGMILRFGQVALSSWRICKLKDDNLAV